MQFDNGMFNDSFRALSPEKLGVSVLELCAEDYHCSNEYEEYEQKKWLKSSEEE